MEGLVTVTPFLLFIYTIRRGRKVMPFTIQNIKLYSVPDVSQILNVTTVSIRNYIKQGHLKGQKVMGRWFVSEEELSNFLKTLSN
jgi:hypothetical protein